MTIIVSLKTFDIGPENSDGDRATKFAMLGWHVFQHPVHDSVQNGVVIVLDTKEGIQTRKEGGLGSGGSYKILGLPFVLGHAFKNQP
jgi:hypothetical protein